MSTRTLVFCRTQFEAFHVWPDCPKDHRYYSILSVPHRHIFHVELGVLVGHDNRDVEFLELKRQVQNHIRDKYEFRTFNFSCEQIASVLRQHFNAEYCIVSEDNENGARVERTFRE